jgi:hypothetical protein
MLDYGNSPILMSMRHFLLTFFLLLLAGCGGNTYEVLNETDNVRGDMNGIVVQTQFVDDDQMEIVLLDLTEGRDDTALVRLQKEEGPESRTYLVDFDENTYELREHGRNAQKLISSSPKD